MQYVLIWAINVFVVPLLVLAAVHYLPGRRLVWTTPLIVLMIAIAELFAAVRRYTPNEPLREQVRMYFHNDVSMGIIVQYLPMVIVAVVCTFLYYVIVKGRKTIPER
jgi:hypothetical protein